MRIARADEAACVKLGRVSCERWGGVLESRGMPQTRGRLVLVGLAAFGALWAAGCQDPLFPERAERSPYERYQALRGESAPRYRGGPGARGEEIRAAPLLRGARGREPALRERLKPLDQR